jgi:hypothetical protein
MVLLNRRLRVLADHVSTDEAKPQLIGVHVKMLDGGRVLAEATDGYQLLRVVDVKPENREPDEYPKIKGVDIAAGEATEAIIPVEAWKMAFAAKKGPFRLPILENVLLILDKDQATFCDAAPLDQQIVIETRTIPASAPNADEVLDKVKNREPKATVHVNAMLLAQLLISMAKVAPPDRPPTVRIDVFEPHEPILIRSTSVVEDYIAEAILGPVKWWR